ncbi:alpha/beta fold hydrolase [Subtercola lobariae]|uniref:alpha/beta fold hydrolase n=1 Tax=Subtercola lobariae TaxID=1588641 RepID=UPI001666A6A5|nr:alpha/beta hydrolase [Subtercola lobariae]
MTSTDKTTLEVDRTGEGPALVLVTGAFNTRQSSKDLSALLADHFTVYEYDRRGRGDSGDTPPYEIARELEDLYAVIRSTGENAFVYGHSSGAIIGLDAAASGVPMAKLAVYEPPVLFEHPPALDTVDALQKLIDAGDREGAAKLFMSATGMPPEQIEWVSHAPFWPGMLGIAHTLPYDQLLCVTGSASSDWLKPITVPVLALAGGTSDSWATTAADRIVSVVGDAESLVVPGQNHAVDPAAVAPLLREFFSA